MNKLNKYEERLLQEWKQHGKIIIAVDFDDTIYPWKFKNLDDFESFDRLINLLQVAKATGAYITIFSACDPERYEEIQKYCEKIKLPIDSINENAIDLPYGNHKKIYYNILLDDRGGLQESINILDKIMYIIRGEQANKLTIGEHG